MFSFDVLHTYHFDTKVDEIHNELNTLSFPSSQNIKISFEQYAAKEFGTCPLVQCNGQPVLPVGLRDEIGVDTAKIFCPKCKSVYQPPPIRSRSGHHSSNSGGGGAVDGAAFGTTFPHLFLMTFNNLVPDPLPANSTYIPRVFGFRVHQSAHRQGGTGSSYPNPNNGRRGGSYGQRVNMTSMRVSRGSGGGGGGGGVPSQVTTSNAVVKDEGKGGGGGDNNNNNKVAADVAGKAATMTPRPTKKAGNNDDEAATAAAAAADAVEGATDGAKEKATANKNDGNGGGDGTSNSSKKRTKSDGAKSGSSNDNGGSNKKSTKRQKVAI